MFQSKLFLIFLLLNIIHGSYGSPYHNRKSSQLLEQPQYDNRYVWFTRDLHNENDINDNKNNQHDILLKKLAKTLHNKNSNKF